MIERPFVVHRYVTAIRNQCFLTKTHWLVCPLTPVGNNVFKPKSSRSLKTRLLDVRLESMSGIPCAPFITTAYGFRKKHFKGVIRCKVCISTPSVSDALCDEGYD